MAKTGLTKAIEKAIIEWHPAQIGDIKINKFRAEHTALEVPVEHASISSGIIDAIRVSEYFGDIEKQHICRVAQWRHDGMRCRIECPLGKDLMKPNLERDCDNIGCQWGSFSEVGKDKILLTAFEIKITKADFKSKHGHNFIGNQNYYVVPNELYPEIADLVPEGVGVLVYHHKESYSGIRTKRRSEFREMADDKQRWLILSIMNRLVQ